MDIKTTASPNSPLVDPQSSNKRSADQNIEPEPKKIKVIDVNDISGVTKFYDFDPPNSCGHRWSSGLSEPTTITPEHRRLHNEVLASIKKDEEKFGYKDFVTNRWG